jgi:arylamine N-acetyltransferase
METYTKEQLAQYFDHIGYQHEDGGLPDPNRVMDSTAIEWLTEIQKRHLATVPFESLSLHYSRHRLLSLDPQDLFQKIVENGRGGYCMEVNTFFATVLRSLGYRLFSTGARVKSETEGFKGW